MQVHLLTVCDLAVIYCVNGCGNVSTTWGLVPEPPMEGACAKAAHSIMCRAGARAYKLVKG